MSNAAAYDNLPTPPPSNDVTAPLVQSVITELYEATTAGSDLSSTIIPPNALVNKWGATPCAALGLPSYSVYYFFGAFIIPVLALLFVLGAWLKRKIKKKWLHWRKRGEYESLEDAEDVLGIHNTQPHLDKIKALVLAAEQQNAIWSWLGAASTSHTKIGERVMIGAIFCALISFLIYLSATSGTIISVEMCGTMPNAAQIIDWIANFYLLCYFIIRLIGTEKKMKVLISGYSLVDYFCIPAVLVSVFQDRYFTGFTFLRCYNLMWTIEVLSKRGALRTPNAVKLCHLLILVIVTLFSAAGFLHLVENKGDFYPLTSVYNGQQISFWRCFLYLYGKVTLIDLSGIRVLSVLGKFTIYGFQILALGIIGRSIPQIIALLKITPEFDKDYITPERFLHIVISGHITETSVKAFLREFYHPDRDISQHFKIVILGDKPPDEGIDRVLKQYFNRADYRRGSIMSLLDLNRIKIFEAAATVLVADKATPDSDSEDAVNIMRVVSIKNFKPDARVIVQILQYHNKAYLQNIPSWKIEAGDIVICIAELRLGLLAQSCYAPGYSTLMSNFFTTRSFSEKIHYGEAWLHDYSRGTSLEMYARAVSDAFIGMTFTQACEFCYLRLKIVLVAIKTDSGNVGTMPQVNPAHAVIIAGSIGYFVADSTEEVDRASYYCAVCHRDIDNPSQIRPCKCHGEYKSGGLMRLFVTPKDELTAADLGVNVDTLGMESKIWSFIKRYPTSPKRSVVGPPKVEEIPQLGRDDGEDGGDASRRPSLDPDQAHFDSTGMFHWCPGRPIEAVVKSRQEAAKMQFSGHIVICILATPGSQIVGLHSFILPLRASFIKEDSLREVVILSDHAFMRKEWVYIMNLPKITVVRGTALNRADLRAVMLNTCMMCIILGSPATGTQMQNVDNALIDRSVILATLNVRAMKFSGDEDIQIRDSEAMSDLGSLSETSSMYQQRKSLKTRARQTGYEVPLVTDLLRESNTQFLDQDDDDSPGTEFYMTQPYACGRAFSSTVLDLLSITSFFNPVIVNVFRTMIFGGASAELEKILAEGAGLIGGSNISQPAQLKGQVIVNQFSIANGPLSVHAENTYGGLFIDALVSFGKLCLGVYRKMDPTDDKLRAAKRFVITNPPEDFILDPTDMIFSLDRPEITERRDPNVGLTGFLSGKSPANQTSEEAFSDDDDE